MGYGPVLVQVAQCISLDTPHTEAMANFGYVSFQTGSCRRMAPSRTAMAPSSASVILPTVFQLRPYVFHDHRIPKGARDVQTKITAGKDVNLLSDGAIRACTSRRFPEVVTPSRRFSPDPRTAVARIPHFVQSTCPLIPSLSPLSTMAPLQFAYW